MVPRAGLICLAALLRIYIYMLCFSAGLQVFSCSTGGLLSFCHKINPPQLALATHHALQPRFPQAPPAAKQLVPPTSRRNRQKLAVPWRVPVPSSVAQHPTVTIETEDAGSAAKLAVGAWGPVLVEVRDACANRPCKPHGISWPSAASLPGTGTRAPLKPGEAAHSPAPLNIVCPGVSSVLI